MKKKHFRILKEIQESVPKEYYDGLITVQPIAPTVKKVFQKAVKDMSLPEEKRKMAQYMLDSGELDKTEHVVDEKKAKKIDKYIEKEIEKAIKLGRLPKEDKKLIKKLKKKYGDSFTKKGNEGESED